MFFLQVVKENEHHIGIENYIGMFLLILLFIAERLINSKEKRKEFRLNWYSTIVILPNLKIVNDFFQDYLIEASKIWENLNSNVLDFGTIQNNEIKVEGFNRLQKLIKNLDFSFLMLIMNYDMRLYNKLLNEVIYAMNDEVLTLLDDKNVSKFKENISDQIKDSKSVFLSQLYSVVQK